MTNEGYSYTVALTREGVLVVNGSTLTPPSYGGRATPDDHLEWALKEIAEQHDQHHETLFLSIEDHRSGGYGHTEVELAPGEYATIEDLRSATGRDLSQRVKEQSPDEDDPVSAQDARSDDGSTGVEQDGALAADAWVDDGASEGSTVPADAPVEQGVEEYSESADEADGPGWWGEAGEGEYPEHASDAQGEPVIFGQTQIDRPEEKTGRGWKSKAAKAARPKPKGKKGRRHDKDAPGPPEVPRTPASEERESWTPYSPAEGVEPPSLDEEDTSKSGKSDKKPRRGGRTRTRTLVAVAVVAALFGGVVTKVLVERSQSTEYVAVCVDQRTQARVETIEPCKEGSVAYYRWWYVAQGERVPAVGGVADSKNGSFVNPDDDAPVTYDYAQGGGVIEKE